MASLQLRSSLDGRRCSLDVGQHAGRSRPSVRTQATTLRRRRNSPLRLPVVPGDPEVDSVMESQEYLSEHQHLRWLPAPRRFRARSVVSAPISDADPPLVCSYDDVVSSADPTLSDCWPSIWDDEQADTDTSRSFQSVLGEQPLPGNGAGPLHSSEHDGVIPAAIGRPSLTALTSAEQPPQPSMLGELARRAGALVPAWVSAKFTPKLRGLVLLNLLVVLVATNWCGLTDYPAMKCKPCRTHGFCGEGCVFGGGIHLLVTQGGGEGERRHQRARLRGAALLHRGARVRAIPSRRTAKRREW